MLSKTLLQRPTGNITSITFDTGDHLPQKAIPFETFVQLINGKVEVSLLQKKLALQQGEFIIIPAHVTYNFIATKFSLMTIAVIKSGYEDVSL